MPQHQGQTDQVKKVQLPSTIHRVDWTHGAVAVGGSVGLQVYTQFVGNNSELKIELTDKSGKSFGNFTDKISGNKFWVQIKVPAGAKDELYANVKLLKHGLSMKSDPLTIIPPVQITSLKWDKKEARRGDVLKLTADVKVVPDGTEARVEIFEHDANGIIELVTEIAVPVQNKRVEATWEFAYHGDVGGIPTEEEMQKVGKHYVPPAYLFRVEIFGVQADSEMLGFRDWVAFELHDDRGDPVPNAKYVLMLPDRTEKKATLDQKGHAKVEGVPPGRCFLSFPRLRNVRNDNPDRPIESRKKPTVVSGTTANLKHDTLRFSV